MAPLGAAAALVLLASACSATPRTPAGMRAWVSQSAYRSSTALLRTDVAEIDRGIAAGRLAATVTACDGLATDAGTALGQLPAPNHSLTLVLNRAYTDLANGAQACSAAKSPAAAAFRTYRREAAAATAALARADREVARLERG